MPDTPLPPPGLVYVSDDAPGIRRLRRGSSFVYRLPDGTPLSDAAQLERIRRLAVPPAYTDVWICPKPRGHLQATGRDARGRKQYRYHAEWRSARDDSKFDRLPAFGAALPRIRARVARDLGAATSRDAVLAAIVRLLDTTLARVGNDAYARENGSFGLTTLRKRHVALRGSALRLRFFGKSGVGHDLALNDARVARIVRRCQALPGQELFQYLDEAGTACSLGSADVNAYLRDASGGEFTAKDFRTWHGSVHALALWCGVAEDERSLLPATAVNRLLADVAGRLGNTVAVCRKSYVHPQVLGLLAGGAAPKRWVPDPAPRKAGLAADERRLLALLSVRNKPAAA